jgi:FKBP-type peptidyl-prolyl cis-trans isomerase
MKKPIVMGIGMISSVILLSGGAILYIRAHRDQFTPISSNGKPITLENSNSSDGVKFDTAPATFEPESTSPTPTNRLKVSSNGLAPSNAPSASTEKTAPGPESFSQYEQYKTNTDPLIGELRLGSGVVAAVNNTATVNYRGWLTNGKEFDESYAKNQPFSFVIGQHRVILGWEKAILGMKAGGKRRFIIPPSDGYGDQTQSGIPANSVLVFDVELLSLK